MGSYGIEKSVFQMVEDKLNQLIDEKAFVDRRIVLFGITEASNSAISILKEKKINVEAVIDNTPERMNLIRESLTVCRPEEKLIPYDDSFLVLIGGNYYNEMLAQLKELGYVEGKNVIRFFSPQEAILNENDSLTEISWDEERIVQLNALKFLRKKCMECQVDYYLAYGSLIGAIRHKAFIPWDNDIDVFVKEKDLFIIYDAIKPEDDYELLLPGVTEGYTFLTPLLVDKRTVSRIMDFPFVIKNGLGLDISSLVGFGKTKEQAEVFLHESYNIVREYKKKLLEKGKEEPEMLRKCIDYSHKYEDTDNNYVGCLFGRTEDSIHIFKKEWFDNILIVPFENDFFSIPSGYNDLLSQLYGNYMELPPKEKRTNSNHPWKNYWIDNLRTEEVNQIKWTKLHTQDRYHPKYPAEEVVQFVFRNFVRDDKTKILDSGCGAGRHVAFMAQEHLIPYGVDYSDTGVDYTKFLLKKSGYNDYVNNIKYGSVTTLPFEDNFFDGVISYGVLYYLHEDEIYKAVSEMKRVLKDGGKIMMIVRSTEDYRYRSDGNDYEILVDDNDKSHSAFSENGMHMFFFTREYLNDLFEGWKDVTIDRIIQTHDNESFEDNNFIVVASK